MLKYLQIKFVLEIKMNTTTVYSQAMTARRLEILQSAFQRERERLLLFVKKRVPASEDAEDLVQDVFFKLTQGVSEIESIEKMSAWLYRVARNRITDFYRKKKEESMPMLRQNDDQETLSLGDILPDLSGGPEMEYTRQLIWEALDEALAELPEEQRHVFVEHEFERKSFNDISEETGVQVNTLLSRKRYAVLHLRNRLQELYEEVFDK